MRWVLYGVIVLVGLAAVIFLIGLMLPATHEVSRSVVLGNPPDEIWAVITDFASNPSWRDDIQRVSRLSDREGRPVWREESKGGDVIPYETIESRPPSRLVRRIADPSLPFGGTWTIDLAPEGARTRVTITENGEVRNAIFRFVSVVILGHTTYIDKYLIALGRRFGQSVQPS